MPTVATKTANSFTRRGSENKYTREPIHCAYDEAVELQALSDAEKIPELIVHITPEEHRIAAIAASEIMNDPAKRAEAIRAAAEELDINNEEHYTKAGLPDARALTGILHWTVTARERDQVFGTKANENPPPAKNKIRTRDDKSPSVDAVEESGETAEEDSDADIEESEIDGMGKDSPDPSISGAVAV